MILGLSANLETHQLVEFDGRIAREWEEWVISWTTKHEGYQEVDQKVVLPIGAPVGEYLARVWKEYNE